MKKIILSVTLFFTIINLSIGQTKCVNPTGGDCINTIVTALPMLRIAPDARSGAMGDAGVAVSTDANAMHYNASKLAFSENDMAISTTYTPWLRALGLSDVFLAYLTGYKKIDELQTVGVGIRYFSLGSISFTDESGAPLGQGNPNELEFAVAYSRKLTDNFAVGFTPKFLYSNLAAGQTVGSNVISPGTAFAADFSLTYQQEIGKDNLLTVGAAFSNIGTKITYTKNVVKDFIPANLGVGVAYQMNINEYNSLAFTLDLNKLLVPTPIPSNSTSYDVDKNGVADYKEQASIGAIFSSFGDAPNGGSEELKEISYAAGMEYWYDKQFAVRLGYFHENALKGNRKYLTTGLGLKYNVFGLNFSYLIPTTSQRNPLDNTLRFSLMFDFGGEERR